VSTRSSKVGPEVGAILPFRSFRRTNIGCTSINGDYLRALLACGIDDTSTGRGPCFVAERRPRAVSRVKSTTFPSIPSVERILGPNYIAFKMARQLMCEDTRPSLSLKYDRYNLAPAIAPSTEFPNQTSLVHALPGNPPTMCPTTSLMPFSPEPSRWMA
jgi:hypothetical protein